MEIRNYQSSDAKEIAKLFHDTIHNIDTTIYSKTQLNAWAPSPIDFEHWQSRLATKKPFVAITNKVIVGFIELENDGHIDCLYVHKDYQRQGIAKKLLAHLSNVAKQKGIRQLNVEASKIAKPFFESFGFETISTEDEIENRVEIRDQKLVNYKMILSINLPE